METTQRSIAKAISWRVVATLITTMIALQLTGKWEFAATLGITDTFTKFFIYFGHERFWNRVSFGRDQKQPEYVI